MFLTLGMTDEPISDKSFFWKFLLGLNPVVKKYVVNKFLAAE